MQKTNVPSKSLLYSRANKAYPGTGLEITMEIFLGYVIFECLYYSHVMI